MQVNEPLSTQSDCHLFSIAPELRNLIYEYALISEEAIDVDCFSNSSHCRPTALLETCQAIRQEASPWTERDFKDPQLGPVLAFLNGGWEKAKVRKIGITAVYTGVFELFWFQLGFVGAPLKENVIWANEKQMKNKVPITAVEHLANALTRIACADPESVKNREYSVVTFWPTGNELKELYTKINGKQAQVKNFTQADREAQMGDGANFGPAKAGYWEKWESGVWGYDTEGRVSDRKYDGPRLEDVARSFA